MLLATINSGTLIIALPDLERSLHTSLLELVWVILAYMIASTVLVLTGSPVRTCSAANRRISVSSSCSRRRHWGRLRPSGTVLILWRILQGIGGAFLFANAAAIVTDAFPKEQLGLAMGTNTMVAAVGLVIGPVLGGALVAISWHWVFWFNVPFALAAASGPGRCCRSSPSAGPEPFRPRRHAGIPGRPHRPGVRHLAGRDLRLGLTAGDRRPRSRPRCCCRCSC